ncbi:MAG: hypothetical protein ACRD2W_05000 [Acidimicrobiales bacterium]
MPLPSSPDDLYGLPLEEFTAARNALAKDLTKGGDKEAAAEVKKLQKPAKTAWALNQLARRQPEVVAKLLESGKRLRKAQQKALDGDAGALRDATKDEQEQVGAALDAALELFGGGAVDRASATAERLRRSLRAAATDPTVGELLREGRLTADVEASGFGLDDLSAGVLPEEAEDELDERDGERDGEDDAEKERERARLQEQRDARRDAERLAKKAASTRERADRFKEEADRAAQRATEAREAADVAEEIAQEAEQLAAAAAKVAARPG